MYCDVGEWETQQHNFRLHGTFLFVKILINYHGLLLRIAFACVVITNGTT